VVGLHFFNPPEKMPLVEVVRAPQTTGEAVATACRLAVALGKLPIVVADSPGFLVNRCLAPYLDEAARLMLEGTAPEDLDRALLDFGMPMGPVRLMDEVGFDVLALVAQAAGSSPLAGSPRAVGSPLFAAVAASGALGRKTGGALYDASGKRPGPARPVLERLRREAGAAARPAPSSAEIVERLVYPMVDEAFRCLDEGVVASEGDLDLGLVMGIGFPPFTGGLARYARATGLPRIVAALDALAARLGERFAVGEGLRGRAEGRAAPAAPAGTT
jgi:3-hydroxyacyl-CoA dehydrogenase/enoyl-CoA hydratase/3-hydroxybutyryl-CoA epimerase